MPNADGLPTIRHFDERVRKARMAQVHGDTVVYFVTCPDCGGEGGFYTPEHPPSRWDDPTTGDRWDECPECHGSGWVEEDEPAPGIEQDELPPPREEVEP